MQERKDHRTVTSPATAAAVISGAYLIIAIAWILGSDLAVGAIFPDFDRFALAQLFKGIGFVSATALTLFLLIRRGNVRIRETERRARDELRFQEDVLSQVSDAVAFAGNDGRLLYANSSALRLYGVAPGKTSELLGRPFSDVVDFEWLDTSDPKRFGEAMESRGRWRGEIVLKTRRRTRVVLDCDVTRVRDEEGREVGALVIARDVTEHRRAERKLRQSERRLSQHFEMLPLAAIEWDSKAGIRRWNRAAEKIFGYSRAEMLGKRDWQMLVPDDERPRVHGVTDRMEVPGEPVHLVSNNRTKDGRTITCEWLNTPLHDEAGNLVGVYVREPASGPVTMTYRPPGLGLGLTLAGLGLGLLVVLFRQSRQRRR